MTPAIETRHRSLEWFAAHEMATLTDDARTLWLFVYAANCESDCHCGEAGVREALAWMDAETFDRAFDDLRDRRLIVRSVYDEQLLLEAIDPSLAEIGEDWQ